MTNWENYFAIWGTCWKSLFKKKGRWHFLELLLSGFCGLGNNSGPGWKIAVRAWKRHHFPHYFSHSCHNHVALSWPMPSTFMTGTSAGLTKALKASIYVHQSFRCILWFQIEPPSNVLCHLIFSSSASCLAPPTDHWANCQRLHWLPMYWMWPFNPLIEFLQIHFNVVSIQAPEYIKYWQPCMERILDVFLKQNIALEHEHVKLLQLIDAPNLWMWNLPRAGQNRVGRGL